MAFKVVNTIGIPGKTSGENLLVPLGVNYIRGLWNTEDELIANCKDADAVIGDIARKPFNRKVMKELTRCRIIAGAVLGYEGVDLEAATELGIAVTNVPDYCIDEVSGRAIAMMLALAYKVVQINKAVKEGQLGTGFYVNAMLGVVAPVYRMRGQTLGLIGCSRIGTATALKASALGLKVIGYDPYVFSGVLESVGIQPVDMDTLLKESDFISLHIPLNPETRNLISYEHFSKMKRTCYFINTSRGGCVDEPALARALKEGLIAGAGLDVTVKEPPDKDNPLLQMPNVILTGHSGWYSVDADAELFFGKPISQVIQALQGKWPIYALNTSVKKMWLEKWGKK